MFERMVESMNKYLSDEGFLEFGLEGSESYSEEGCNRYYFRSDDVSAEVLGVKHNKDFYDENKEYLRAFLDGKDAVMVEDVNSGGLFNNDFYGSLVEEARKRDVDVFSSDPFSTALHNIDMAVGLAGSYVFYRTLREMGADGSSIKELFDMGGSGYLAAGSVVGTVLNVGLGLDNLRKYFYGVHDYRDVCLTGGVSKIVDEGYKDIGVVAGNGHHDSLKYYLENPGPLGVKKKLYRPFEFFGDSSLRRIDLSEQSY